MLDGDGRHQRLWLDVLRRQQKKSWDLNPSTMKKEKGELPHSARNCGQNRCRLNSPRSARFFQLSIHTRRPDRPIADCQAKKNRSPSPWRARCTDELGGRRFDSVPSRVTHSFREHAHLFELPSDRFDVLACFARKLCSVEAGPRAFI